MAINTTATVPTEIATYPTLRAPRPVIFDPNRPYVAFFPCNPRFTPPLDCLKFGEYLPIDSTSSNGVVTYYLERETRQRWWALEGLLIRIGSLLSQYMEIYVPLDFQTPDFPRDFGYHRINRTERYRAKGAIMASRDAFLHYIAYISFLMNGLSQQVRYRDETEQVDVVVLKWQYILLRSRSINPDLIQDILTSDIYDFSEACPRVGAIVDLPADSLCHHTVRNIYGQHGELPVWIWWNESSKKPILHNFVVTKDAIAEAKRDEEEADPKRAEEAARLQRMEEDNRRAEALDQGEGLDVDMNVDTWATANDEPTTSLPALLAPPRKPHSKLPLHSKQIPGESPLTFIARMKETNAQRVETPRDTERRESRAKSNSDFHRPSRAVVYEWLMDHDLGYRVRTRVNRPRVPEVWEEYGNSRKIYDPYADEWDVCTEFDPTEAGSAFNDDDDDDDNPYAFLEDHQPLMPSLPSVQPPSSPPPPTVDTQYNLPALCAAAAYRPVDIPEWSELLFTHFGFIDVGDPLDMASAIHLKSVGEIFCLSKDDMPRDDRSKKCLNFFAHSFSSCENKGVVSLCDLNSIEIFSKTMNPNLRSHKLHLRLESTPDYITTQGRYAIASVGPRPSPPYQLAVDSDAAAMECLRQAFEEPDDFLKHLFDSGIPFHTYIAVKPQPLPAVRPNHEVYRGLGIRDHDHFPTINDYHRYIATRDAYLRTNPQGRAALMCGGIVWRLAMEALGYRDGLESVLRGPSASCPVHGTVGNGTELRDDALSLDEMNLVIGHYYFLPPDHKGNVTADLSWWPKQSTFLSSGLWPGYWSSKAEKWFKERRAAIEEGKAEPKTASQWRKVIKYSGSKLKPILQRYEQVAYNFREDLSKP